jgi:hypothetical protein
MSKKADGARWLLWILVLGLCLPARAEAYLDPGTGSMLLSALVGVAATLLFLLKTLYYRLAGTAHRLRGTRAPRAAGGLVFYSEGSRYWNTFKPVLESLDALGQKALYLTSDPEDPGLSHPLRHGEARYIGKGNRAFAVLNMLEADICVLTTPGLDVLQIRRSPGVRHYAHLVHAVTDMAIYKLFSFDYFDSVLCSGRHQMRSLRHLERLRGTREKLLLETGCPYLDVLADKVRSLPAFPLSGTKGEGPRLLLAPTWGANGLLSRFGERLLEPLVRNGFPVTVRPHPQSFLSEKALLERLRDRFASHANLRWDSAPDGFAAMAESDVLISDLSGIVFDYAFVLERPVISVRFTPDTRGLEAGDLPWPAWELGILPELGAHVPPEAVAHLPEVIASLPGGEAFRLRMRTLREESLFQYGRAGETAARQLLDVRRSRSDQPVLIKTPEPGMC